MQDVLEGNGTRGALEDLFVVAGSTFTSAFTSADSGSSLTALLATAVVLAAIATLRRASALAFRRREHSSESRTCEFRRETVGLLAAKVCNGVAYASATWEPPRDIPPRSLPASSSAECCGRQMTSIKCQMM